MIIICRIFIAPLSAFSLKSLLLGAISNDKPSASKVLSTDIDDGPEDSSSHGANRDISRQTSFLRAILFCGRNKKSRKKLKRFEQTIVRQLDLVKFIQ